MPILPACTRSTFDRWVAEVVSRRLKWGTLVHDEKFWRENARLLEQNDFELLKYVFRHEAARQRGVGPSKSSFHFF